MAKLTIVFGLVLILLGIFGFVVTGHHAPTALIPGGTPATFTITAIPAPGSMQVSDTACAVFTINSAGQQAAFNSGGTDNTANCWQN